MTTNTNAPLWWEPTMDIHDQDVRASGLDRREFIRRSAMVGGLVWASPMIRTFSSPAFAGTPLADPEGCTPGFWKDQVPANEQAWAAVLAAEGVGPSTQFRTVFDSDVFGAMTLREVLGQGGGGLNRLGRHATAGWLNAVSGLDYPLSADDVVELFNEAVAEGDFAISAAGDRLEAANTENCPWGAGPQTDTSQTEQTDAEQQIQDDTSEDADSDEVGSQDTGSADTGSADTGSQDVGEQVEEGADAGTLRKDDGSTDAQTDSTTGATSSTAGDGRGAPQPGQASGDDELAPESS